MAKKFDHGDWGDIEPAKGNNTIIFAERRISAKAVDGGGDVLQCQMAFDITGIYRTTWVVPVTDPPNVSIDFTLSHSGDNIVVRINGFSTEVVSKEIEKMITAYTLTLDPVTIQKMAYGHLEKYSLEAGRSAIEVAAVSV